MCRIVYMKCILNVVGNESREAVVKGARSHLVILTPSTLGWHNTVPLYGRSALPLASQAIRAARGASVHAQARTLAHDAPHHLSSSHPQEFVTRGMLPSSN